ncbi:hypothetical protein P7K49_026753 [Saguinus oedipus]|uniref:Uncharacterized protein n=1 Tax=Saguinus oedipus TaxID=9490 RepID=A0ABQ9UE34_SAGOE|nr:hypothetical protein P7K49_026753 [Saguinus oedipus]
MEGNGPAAAQYQPASPPRDACVYSSCYCLRVSPAPGPRVATVALLFPNPSRGRSRSGPAGSSFCGRREREWQLSSLE